MRSRIGQTSYCVTAGITTLLILPVMVRAQDAKQKLLERVFGDAVKLDPATVEKVKALPANEPLTLDRNGDGQNDEVWYIDGSPRHQKKSQPLLVRVIDEDGDLDAHKGPDLDSDLYVGDWNADGTVDVVIDYTDTDRDGDVDDMALYYWSPKDHYLGADALRVWWGRDDGDDNLLWYDVNLTYQQPECQWHSHFGGDETFVAFGLTEDSDHWVSIWENPFVFYDPDGDGASEVVIRFSGLAEQVEALRYSFDADDDASPRRAHDYDFSITAIAPGSRWLRNENTPASDLVLPEEITAGMTLRGIPTGRWLRRQDAESFARKAPWAKAVLTWDEMNANTDGNVRHDPHERWEGVIAHPSENFPQIGGPTCGALNKRNEVSVQPVSPLTLYWHPADQRFHLKGAGEGWVHVDFDLDGRVDARYLYLDENKDGVFDRRQIDVNADQRIEFDFQMPGDGVREVEVSLNAVAVPYQVGLEKTLADSQYFIDAVRFAAMSRSGRPDPAEVFFLTKLEAWMPETKLGARMRQTPAGARLYVELVRDRMLAALKSRLEQHSGWKQVEALYAQGDYRAAADAIREMVPGTPIANPASFGAFTQRIPLKVNNSTGPLREGWPMVIPLKQIQAVAGDFNPQNCAVVAPERWLDWRQIPHQVDEADPVIGPELTFLADVKGASSPTFYLYFGPGKSDAKFPARTASAQDWVPPNIGWESGRGAYRAYWGQFDFFGKKTDQLLYPTIGKKSYHDEVEWGIDALLVGKTSGLGGLTFYEGEKGYPAQNPAGEGNVKFTKKELVAGPVRCAVEITAENIVPDSPELKLRLTCLIYADRQETEVRVAASGATGEVLLAPGLMRLAREEVFGNPAAGYFGTWGFQAPVIGEIGMGLIGAPSAFRRHVDEPQERRMIMETSNGGRLRYWLIGDWRRGRQYPVAPTTINWHKELAALAGALNNDVRIEIAKAENAG
ncbi:MAG: hypothetical protein AMXMBFR13_49600 [Phycisphaerae bacterium]